MTDKAGSLIVDLQGTSVSAEDSEILNHPPVGGVILFARNYESREQLTQLCRQIRKARKAPLVIMVDQEGGRVQRFTHEFTRLPFMAVFGKLHDENPALAKQLAEDCGWLMAMELLSTGVDLSLAPVLDLNKGVSTVIGERAFDACSQNVITLASAFMRGMHEAGMPATGKHFPGHGGVVLDSHVANPVDERSLQELEHDDMQPFAGLIKAGLPAVMAAHIIFPNVDAKPVGYSSVWLKEILRHRLGFDGLILSDDLSMEGASISSNYAERVKSAREAGCDIALLCNNRKGVEQTLDELKHTYLLDADKWSKLQADFSGTSKELYQSNPRWIKTRDVLTRLHHES